MSNLSVTKANELIGTSPSDQFYIDNRDEFKLEVFTCMLENGFPVSLWPSDPVAQDRIIHRAKALGKLPRTVITEAPVDMTPYDGVALDKSVMQFFEASFPMLGNAMYVFTEGEDWWPGRKSFLADNAWTYLEYCLYHMATVSQGVLDGGMPRIVAGKAAKSGTPYSTWLVECAAYREQVAEKHRLYLEAKAVMETRRNDWKLLQQQGAPVRKA